VCSLAGNVVQPVIAVTSSGAVAAQSRKPAPDLRRLLDRIEHAGEGIDRAVRVQSEREGRGDTEVPTAAADCPK